MACSHSPAGSLTLAGPSLLYSVTLISAPVRGLSDFPKPPRSHWPLQAATVLVLLLGLCAKLPFQEQGWEREARERSKGRRECWLSWGGGGGGGEAFLYGVMSIPGEKRVSCSCLGLHVQMVHVHA